MTRGARPVGQTYAGYALDARRRRAWAADNPGNAAIREELTGAMLAAAAPQLAGGGALLDAGCGTGWWLARLAAEGVPPRRLHGVDLLEERIAAARRAVPGASVAVADVRSLPFEDRAFAAVFLVTVLSSIRDTGGVPAAVAETWRVLAPGGVLVVWEPRIPTPNRATRRIRARDLASATGVSASRRTLTVLPPLARRLGRAAPSWYPRLARLAPLRTHRLITVERPGG